MRILHLLSQHPESTGSGFYIQNSISQAQQQGYTNHLLAGISDNREPVLHSTLQLSTTFLNFGTAPLGFKIPGMSDVMPYPSSRFTDLTPGQIDAYEEGWAEIIRQTVADFKPDLIHSHHLWLMSGVARRVCPHIPMVTSCHSTDLRQFLQCPHLQQRVLAATRGIDRILALSEAQATQIQGQLGVADSKIAIVGGGFDSDRFVFQEKSPPPVQLLYAGKLSFAKGVDWLLQAVAGIDEKRVHLHLAGSGTGEEQQRCLELAQQLGGAVTVHGRLDQQQLALLMGRCHIFILPSYYEGLPLVLLEALASGCRIITTNLPGCMELLGTAEPDLVDIITLPELQTVDTPRPEDLGMLKEQLKSSILNMTARAEQGPTPSASAIQSITSHHSWDGVFKRIESAYQQVVMEKPSI